MTHGTIPAHLARATFEAIALQIADVFTVMQAGSHQTRDDLLADGGASSNDFLMQLQADTLQKPVQRASVEEIDAIGVAALAFAALGEPMTPAQSTPTRFTPRPQAATMRINWSKAIAKACL